MEEPNKNVDKTYTDPVTGKFIKGNPGGGRPEGSISILTDLKIRLRKIKETNPEEYEKLIDDYWRDRSKRELLIKMVDGMPRQQTDLTTDGQKIEFNVNLSDDDKPTP
jgi:hypothetical protein